MTEENGNIPSQLTVDDVVKLMAVVQAAIDLDCLEIGHLDRPGHVKLVQALDALTK